MATGGEAASLARRREREAQFRDYDVAAEEGMVVLDVHPRLQATQAGGPGGALELQGRASAARAAPRSTGGRG